MKGKSQLKLVYGRGQGGTWAGAAQRSQTGDAAAAAGRCPCDDEPPGRVPPAVGLLSQQAGINGTAKDLNGWGCCWGLLSPLPSWARVTAASAETAAAAD